jgi:hypothetical protein
MTMTAEQTETDLLEQVAAFYADPLGYVLFAFEWGEGALAEHDGPDDWQRDVLTALGEGTLTPAQAIRIAVASGHGIGKGALIAWIVLWAMSTRPDLTGTVTANTKSQLDTKTWRELAVWHNRAINKHWFKWTATKFYHVDRPETWYVQAVPWAADNVEAFQGQHGEHVLVLYDEASGIDDPIWGASDGAMTGSNAIWCAFGNPTRPVGRFRDCFPAGKYSHRWRSWQIDSRTCRMTNKDLLQQWVEDEGEDHDYVRVKVRGQFPRSAVEQFISQDIVDAAQRRKPAGHGPKILGVDVAKFGNNRTVILLRHGDRVNILCKLHNLDEFQVATRVAEQMDAISPDAVMIDGVGVGGGVVTMLRTVMNREVDSINGSHPARHDDKYTNLRAEMWGLMRDWLKEGGCLPDDRDLAAELVMPEYSFDSRNRYKLEKKENMKSRGQPSPDCADALALTFAKVVAPKHIHRRPRGHRRGLVGGKYSWLGF